MSETPRTDAAILDYHGMVVEEEGCVPAALCRKLERELNELNEWKAGMKGVEEFYALRSQYHTYVLAMNRIIMACEATKDCQNKRMDEFVVAQIERLRRENAELKAIAEKLAKELRGWLESDYPASTLEECEVLAEFERMKQPLTPALSPRPTKGEGEAG